MIRRLFLVLGLLVLAGCAGTAGLTPPDVSLVDMRLLPSTSAFEQRFALTLRVTNPNDEAITLDGLTFALDVNDQELATGLSNQVVPIERLSEARVEVSATTSLLAVMQQILAIGSRDALDYRLAGKVYLQDFILRSVPFERTGRLTLQDALSGVGPGAAGLPTLVPR